ncbi:uncharacterized protein LOC132637992 [Lycium barbarum]|uniref:uncharacterized protein LOC132637992 n=1 Tax=Lycium barbarum TaxID=112863 RepID=UPI00293F653A|nr:uncharacterized protein LOC132637992 [Lycium barbarum]
MAPRNIRVSWKSIVLGDGSLPRYQFQTWLALHQKLATVDRLERWGIHVSKYCVLCDSGDEEDLPHLLFNCVYSRHIWEKLLGWIGENRQVQSWIQEMSWVTQRVKGNRARVGILKFLFTSAVYHIWSERNARRFQGNMRSSQDRLREIVRQLHLKGNQQPKWKQMLAQLNNYPN